MAVKLIPTEPDEPFYSQETELDGVRYVLEYRYSQRENVWRLTVGLPDGTTLAGGIKLVCHFPLLKYRSDVRLPPGLLAVLASGTNDASPGLGELGEGRRCTLTYTPLADLAAL